MGFRKGLYILGCRLRTGQTELESSGFVGRMESDRSLDKDVGGSFDVDVLVPVGGGGDDACISPLELIGAEECRSQGC